MRKILIGLTVLVLGVTFVVPGFARRGGRFDASATVDTSVIWEVPAFIELLVSADSFTFPEFDPGIDEYLAEKAVVLYVFSNSDWSLPTNSRATTKPSRICPCCSPRTPAPATPRCRFPTCCPTSATWPLVPTR